ncbi:hypothetical protein MRX96_027504 [Rhipicephalus microplus]
MTGRAEKVAVFFARRRRQVQKVAATFDARNRSPLRSLGTDSSTVSSACHIGWALSVSLRRLWVQAAREKPANSQQAMTIRLNTTVLTSTHVLLIKKRKQLREQRRGGLREPLHAGKMAAGGGGRL